MAEGILSIDDLAKPSPPLSDMTNQPIVMSAMSGSSLTPPRPTPIPSPQPASTEAKIVAIIAAARGNMGPLFELTEQKRKTKVYQQAADLQSKAYDLINQGKVNEGAQLFEEGITALGGRAPEIGQFLNPVMSRISQMQLWDTQKKSMQEQLDVRAEQLELTGQEQQAKYVRLLSKGLKSFKYPLSPDQIKEYTQSILNPELRFDNGQVMRMGPLGTTTEQIPMTFQESSIGGDVAKNVLMSDPELQKVFGNNLSIPNIVNIMRSNDPQAVPLQQLVNQRIQTAQAQELKLKEAGNVPLNPDFVAALLRGGASPKDIANRNIGPGTAQAGIEYTAQKAGDVLAEQERVRQRQDVYRTSGGESTVIVRDRGSDNFGQERRGISYDDAARDPNLAIVQNKDLRETIRPLMRAQRDLEYVDMLFDQVGDPDTWMERISTGLANRLSGALGVAISPEMTGRKVAEVIVNRAIRSLDATPNIDKEDMASLRAFVTGGFADVNQAKQAVGVIKNLIDRDLSPYIDQGKAAPPPLQKSVRAIARPPSSNMAAGAETQQQVQQGNIPEGMTATPFGIEDKDKALKPFDITKLPPGYVMGPDGWARHMGSLPKGSKKLNSGVVLQPKKKKKE